MLLRIRYLNDVSNLVKKRDYDAHISHTKSKYFTTSDYNKFTTDIIDNKIKERELVKKSNVSGFINNSDLDKKITILAAIATKAELKAEQDKIVKRYTFDSSYFQGKSHFEDDITQNYLVFQLIYRYFKRIGNSVHISVGKSTGLSDESITPPAT